MSKVTKLTKSWAPGAFCEDQGRSWAFLLELPGAQLDSTLRGEAVAWGAVTHPWAPVEMGLWIQGSYKAWHWGLGKVNQISKGLG